MAITESLLEMHYHRPLLELFTEFFGSGGVNFSLYKYSPQKEKFVGFDQAFAMTTMDDEEFFSIVKAASDSPPNTASPTSPKFLCYFLQYKVVQRMSNKSKYLPAQVTDRPYYRVKLDTVRKTGELSQHERLFNLSRRSTCLVYYACPMLFDKIELYNLKPPLDDLALADVETCPSDYTDNDRHFIYFNSTTADPVWCSEPVDGEAIRPKILVQKLRDHLSEHSAEELARILVEDISSIVPEEATHPATEETMPGAPDKEFLKFRSGLRMVADSVRIIRVE